MTELFTVKGPKNITCLKELIHRNFNLYTLICKYKDIMINMMKNILFGKSQKKTWH